MNENADLGGFPFEEEGEWEDGSYTSISPRPWFFSASQIDTFLACPRKWAWRYIAKKRGPDHPSAKLGTEMHRLLENYLRDGTPLPFSDPSPLTREAAAIASPSLVHLPQPKTPGMAVERKFTFKSGDPLPHGPLLFTGKVDVSLSPLATGTSVPKVIDHKSSSNMSRYAKTPDDLEEDPQAILYAYDAMVTYKSKVVDLEWIYSSTRGARKSMPVRLRLHASHVVPRFLAFRPALMQLHASLHSNRTPESFPGDESHCDAFGGCPYKADCAPLFKNTNPFSRMNTR